MEFLKTHFPKLTTAQLERLEQLPQLYKDWNAKINVISRKDIDNFTQHHLLHSLALSKIIQFKDGAAILDLGTGGGLPGIPLAVLFPNVHFTLIDGTRKKIKVVEAIVEALQLENVTAKQQRAEELKAQFDFVICRAVASLDKLIMWSKPLLKRKHIHALPNGLLTLKGGNIDNEIQALPRKEYIEIFPLEKYFEIPYFQEKLLVYVQG